jgi:hypothetical protein
VNELDFQVKELEQKLYSFHFGDDQVAPEQRREERKNMQLRLSELKDELAKYQPAAQVEPLKVGRGVGALP